MTGRFYPGATGKARWLLACELMPVASFDHENKSQHPNIYGVDEEGRPENCREAPQVQFNAGVGRNPYADRRDGGNDHRAGKSASHVAETHQDGVELPERASASGSVFVLVRSQSHRQGHCRGSAGNECAHVFAACRHDDDGDCL